MAMNEILSAAKKFAPKDGRFDTAIPFLSFIRTSSPTTFTTGMLKPSFCLVVQGDKRILIGKDVINYGMGSFIISTIDLPTSGQVVTATKAVPYVGIVIELDANEIAAIALEAELVYDTKTKSRPGAFIAKSDEDIQAVVLRLLKLLAKSSDAKFLAATLRRELIYRLLTSAEGHLLYQNAVKDYQEQGIGKAISWLKKNYTKPIKMEALAKAMNMSVSSLHHKFKTVTTMGPLQYQKHLRLQEARRLLLLETMDAATASYKVGYESPSQFSREYKRLFGASPLEDIRNLKNTHAGHLQE
jgi:AraC-like DNA-binding protein